MAFYVGQKVEFYRDFDIEEVRRHLAFRGITLPVLGKVYTIRAMTHKIGQDFLLLEEITNAPVDFDVGTMEPPFGADRFRPVVERKTSIAIFTAMLNPSDERVDA